MVEITYIGTREAAFLLGICSQRLTGLLREGRIKGAYKQGRFWQIPLCGKMPVIIPGTRGPKGAWCQRERKQPTKIHVNQLFIKANKKKVKKNPQVNSDQLMPVISLKQTHRNDMGYQLEIEGPCRIVYNPFKPLPCGAQLWIETYEPVKFIDTQFNPYTTRQSYKNVERRYS